MARFFKLPSIDNIPNPVPELPFKEAIIALNQKQTDFDKANTTADELAKLLPEGGYRTSERATMFKEKYNPQIESILTELQKTGNSSKAMANIKSLAREISNNPEYKNILYDEKYRSEAEKINRENKGAVFNYLDKSGNYIQTKKGEDFDPSWYEFTPKTDWIKEYQGHFNLLKPSLEKIKTYFPDLKIGKSEDGEIYYYQEGEYGQEEYIDKDMLLNFITGDNKEYTNTLFEGQGEGLAFRKASYEKDLGLEYDINKYREDVLGVNLIRMYEHSVTEQMNKKVSPSKDGSGSGSKKASESTFASLTSIATSRTQQPLLPSSANTFQGMTKHLEALSETNEQRDKEYISEISTQYTTAFQDKGLEIPNVNFEYVDNGKGFTSLIVSGLDYDNLSQAQQQTYNNFYANSVLPINSIREKDWSTYNGVKQILGDLNRQLKNGDLHPEVLKNADKVYEQALEEEAITLYRAQRSNAGNPLLPHPVKVVDSFEEIKPGYYPLATNVVLRSDLKDLKLSDKTIEAANKKRDEYLSNYSPQYKEIVGKLNNLTQATSFSTLSFVIPAGFNPDTKRAREGVISTIKTALAFNPSNEIRTTDNRPLTEDEKKLVNKFLYENSQASEKDKVDDDKLNVDNFYNASFALTYDPGDNKWMADIAINDKLKIEYPIEDVGLLQEIGLQSQLDYSYIQSMENQLRNSLGTYAEFKVGDTKIELSRDIFNNQDSGGKLDVTYKGITVKANTTLDALNMFYDLNKLETEILPNPYLDAEQKRAYFIQGLQQHGFSPNQIQYFLENFNQAAENEKKKVTDNQTNNQTTEDKFADIVPTKENIMAIIFDNEDNTEDSTGIITNNKDNIYQNMATELMIPLMKQESNYDPSAVSKKGAFGLTQIMSATGKNPGFNIKPLPDNYEQLSAEEQIKHQYRLGRDYLEALLDKYKGDKVLALAAYNWGTGNVDKWIKYDKKDITALPLETQKYINNILNG